MPKEETLDNRSLVGEASHITKSGDHFRLGEGIAPGPQRNNKRGGRGAVAIKIWKQKEIQYCASETTIPKAFFPSWWENDSHYKIEKESTSGVCMGENGKGNTKVTSLTPFLMGPASIHICCPSIHREHWYSDNREFCRINHIFSCFVFSIAFLLGPTRILWETYPLVHQYKVL